MTDLPTPRSRLQIKHLLAWTAACAIVAAARTAWTDWESLPAENHNYLRVGHLIMSLAYGAGLASLLIVFWRRWRSGLAFPADPGHWLLILIATAAVVDGLSTFAIRIYNHSHGAPSWEYYSFHTQQAAVLVTLATVCVIFARSMHADLSWSLTLLLLGGILLGLASIHALLLAGYRHLALWHVREYAQLFAAVGLGLVMLVVSILDRRRFPNRDWLHWGGVTVFLAVLSMSTTLSLYWLLQI